MRTSPLRRTTLALLACALVSPVHGADPAAPSTLEQRIAGIMGPILADGRVLRTLETLTNDHPHRMTGTDGHAAAVEWAAQQLRDAGVRDVRLEPFTLANRWRPRAASATMLGAKPYTLHVASVPWSPSTPAEGIEAELVMLTPDDMKDAARLGERVRGRIVLASPRAVLAEMDCIGDDVVARFHRELAAAGARAVLFGSMQPNNVVKTVALLAPAAGAVVGLPAASVGMEDALMLRRLAMNGSVRVALLLDNEVGGPIEVHNVIATLPGREHDGEWVLAGAHLDAWPVGSAANDNGVGVSAVIETARALANADAPLRRTVRFALWAGEEQGVLGSSAFVRAHAAELDGLALAINHDHGAAKPKGWAIPGRADLAASFAAAGNPVFLRFGATTIDTTAPASSDTVSFVLAGVPALDLAADVPQRFAARRDAAAVEVALTASSQLGCLAAGTRASSDAAGARASGVGERLEYYRDGKTITLHVRVDE